MTYCSISSDEEKPRRREESLGDATITVHWYDPNGDLGIVGTEED